MSRKSGRRSEAENYKSLAEFLTILVFTFLAAWGDLLMALSLITDEAMRPVTSEFFKYMGNNVSQWNMVMGFTTLEMIPL